MRKGKLVVAIVNAHECINNKINFKYINSVFNFVVQIIERVGADPTDPFKLALLLMQYYNMNSEENTSTAPMNY